MRNKTILKATILLPPWMATLYSIITDSLQKLNLRYPTYGLRRPRLPFPFKNYIGVLLVILITLISFYLGGRFNGRSQSYQDERPQGASVKARQVLNKSISFPLKNEKGQEINRIAYTIESAELQDSIIVKGQRARAVKGRTFLILNLKIRNQHSQGIEINSSDYIRLFVSDRKEPLAPDIHNDPVKVQAISVKPTRVGFPINDNDNDLTIQVGEIKGNKELVKLKLQRV